MGGATSILRTETGAEGIYAWIVTIRRLQMDATVLYVRSGSGRRAPPDVDGLVFGYDAEEVVGDSINEHVLPEGEHETGRELDRRTAAGERPRCEVRRRTANGLREFLLRGVPYETGDGTTWSSAAVALAAVATSSSGASVSRDSAVRSRTFGSSSTTSTRTVSAISLRVGPRSV